MDCTYVWGYNSGAITLPWKNYRSRDHCLDVLSMAGIAGPVILLAAFSTWIINQMLPVIIATLLLKKERNMLWFNCLLVAYLFFLLFLLIGYRYGVAKRKKDRKKDISIELNDITVVIPFRDEKENLECY